MAKWHLPVLVLASMCAGVLACEDSPDCRNGVDCQWVSAEFPRGIYGGCALRQNGEVYCFGEGQRIRRRSDLDSVSSLCSGFIHRCALRDDGSVWCWGENDYGQLGDGTTESREAAGPVAGLGRVSTIACGGRNTYAVLEDGSVQSWGIIAGSTVPVSVWDEPDATAVAAGEYHFCVLRADGVLFCRGSNFYGELGDGTLVDRDVMTRVQGVEGVVQASAGYGRTCAVTGSGEAWCWGASVAGTEDATVPELLPSLADVRSISVGAGTDCVIDGAGRAFCWGSGSCGELGDGEVHDWLAPVADAVLVKGLSEVVRISPGRIMAAITRDGTLWGWGQTTITTSYADSYPLAIGDHDRRVQYCDGGSEGLAVAEPVPFVDPPAAPSPDWPPDE